MRKILTNKWAVFAFSLLILATLLLAGCSNLTPLDPTSPPKTPVEPGGTSPITVTYTYGDTDKVQLSANNLVLKVGQKLILKPAPGLNKTTRFSSSGENFWGDIMKQEQTQPDSTTVEFTAIKPGKGRLQIIPNGTQTDRATDLWATVQ